MAKKTKKRKTKKAVAKTGPVLFLHVTPANATFFKTKTKALKKRYAKKTGRTLTMSKLADSVLTNVRANKKLWDRVARI